MYVAGGLTTDGTRLSSVESYDLPNNVWFPCAPLREARSSAMAFSVGSKFYVVGGENGRSADQDDGVLRTMEVYDEDLGSPHFQYGVSMPSPRCAASFGVIDDKFILAGGRGPGFEMLTSTIVYDVESETWTERASMPEPVEHGGCAVIEGKLYVLGGFSPEFSDEIFIYDFAADTWTKSNHVIPSPGGDSTVTGACHGLAATYVGDSVVITGGYDAHGIRNSVDAWDVNQCRWHRSYPDMRVRMGGHACVTVRLSEFAVVRAADGARILNKLKQKRIDDAKLYKASLIATKERIAIEEIKRASTAPARTESVAEQGGRRRRVRG